MKKKIGILGGMGPEATVYMYDNIVKRTKVEKDQDHIHVIINSYPKVPPRTVAILNEGPSPTPYLVEGIKTLNAAGADFIIIPCVTAHHFLSEVKQEVDFDYISLLDEALAWTKRHYPKIKTVGIISSTGTLISRLFHDCFAEQGIELISPNHDEQDDVMDAIFGDKGIKAGFTQGKPKDMIVDVAIKLISKGAEAILAGCTEVPLVLLDEDIPSPLIEPMQIVAEASIVKAGYELKKA